MYTISLHGSNRLYLLARANTYMGSDQHVVVLGASVKAGHGITGSIAIITGIFSTYLQAPTVKCQWWMADGG